VRPRANQYNFNLLHTNMKLHLPKLLLTAVLAACVAPVVWAETITSDTTWSTTQTITGDVEISGDKTLTIATGAEIDGVGELRLLRNGSGSKVSITGGSITVNSIDMHTGQEAYSNGSGHDVINISGGTLTVNKSDEAYVNDYNKWAAVTVGHWGNSSGKASIIMTGGEFNVLNGTVNLGYEAQAVLDISGGTANVKGLQFGHANKGNNASITLSDTGRLNVGTGGIKNTGTGGNKSVTLSGGTLGALGDWVMSGTMNVSLSGSVAFDTADVENAATGYSITINPTVKGAGSITKKGAGTLAFKALENTGDMDINVTGGAMTIESLITGKTLDVSVSTGSLNISSVTLNTTNWVPTSSSYFYSEDGTTESTSGNGFKVDSSTYLLFDGYEWDGSINGYTVNAENGQTSVTAQGTAGSVFYVGGDFTVDGTDANVAKNATAYVFIGETGKGSLTIEENQSDSMTADKILSETTGKGDIELAYNTSLNSNQTTKATGKLTIANKTQLNLGDNEGDTASLSSFTSIELDGATIRFQNQKDTFQNLSVTSNGGTIHSFDMQEAEGDKLLLKDTTTLNGNLTYSNVWNSQVEVEKLAGTGNLIINSANTIESDDDYKNRKTDNSSTFTILGKDADYTGEVQMVGSADSMKLVVAKNLGLNVRVSTTSGSVNMTGVGDGNKVIMAGAVGALFKDGTIAADVEFENYDSDGDGNDDAGMKINTGVSGNRYFTGDISGSGNFLTDTDATMTLTFSGDVSEWTGKMEIVKGTHNVKYTGSATDVRSETILARGTGKANVTFDHTTKATVASSIADTSTDGGMHVTVKNSSADGTTFTGSAISMRSLQVEDNTLTAFTGVNTLTMTNLTMKSGAKLHVGTGVATASTTFSNGVKVTGTANLAGGATMSALDLSTATVLTLNGIGEDSLVNITGEFVLPVGSLTLSGNILETLAALEDGSQLNVFSVGSFTMGGESITADFGVEKALTLDNVFTGHDLGSDYYLGYTAPAAGGYGTVYIGKIVPEPTTATLSLLALAALAARRRRR